MRLLFLFLLAGSLRGSLSLGFLILHHRAHCLSHTSKPPPGAVAPLPPPHAQTPRSGSHTCGNTHTHTHTHSRPSSGLMMSTPTAARGQLLTVPEFTYFFFFIFFFGFTTCREKLRCKKEKFQAVRAEPLRVPGTPACGPSQRSVEGENWRAGVGGRGGFRRREFREGL